MGKRIGILATRQPITYFLHWSLRGKTKFFLASAYTFICLSSWCCFFNKKIFLSKELILTASDQGFLPWAVCRQQSFPPAELFN